jgi:hypothetical protein
MLTDIGNPEACFFSRIMENRGCNDLWRAAKGGHDVAAYLYAILLYRENGSATNDDTAKRYMRRVAGGGSMTSRWLSKEGVSAFVQEGHACDSLFDLAHLG